MKVELRQAGALDHAFVESTFFTTQRWIIERLFGWRGDEFEHQRFLEDHRNGQVQIITADGIDAGWLSIERCDGPIDIKGIYILPAFKKQGIGTKILRNALAEAAADRKSVTLSVAKINPARRLYERLGFVIVEEGETKIFMAYSPAASAGMEMLKPEHFEEVAHLWYRCQLARGGATSAADATATPQLIRERAVHSDTWFAGSRADGRLVTIAHGMHGRVDDGSGEPISGLMHLSMIAVDPTLWGQGRGRAATQFALRVARERGYGFVQLWTHLHNARARRLYESIGFVASGRQKDDGLGNQILHYTLKL